MASNGGETKWMEISGDQKQNYLPRMQWSTSGQHLLVQQLNRKQNHMKLWWSDAKTGQSTKIYEEKEEAWIDAVEEDDWLWLNNGEAFTWTSEKDGWQNVYQISKNGKKVLTPAQSLLHTLSVV